MLHNATLELISLLIDEIDRVHANFQLAPLLVALDVDLADTQDPLETVLPKAIFDRQEASNRLEALLDIVHVRLLDEILRVDLGHLLRVHEVVGAHEVEHLGEIDCRLTVYGGFARFDQLLQNGLALTDLLSIF